MSCSNFYSSYYAPVVCFIILALAYVAISQKITPEGLLGQNLEVRKLLYCTETRKKKTNFHPCILPIAHFLLSFNDFVVYQIFE